MVCLFVPLFCFDSSVPLSPLFDSSGSFIHLYVDAHSPVSTLSCNSDFYIPHYYFILLCLFTIILPTDSFILTISLFSPSSSAAATASDRRRRRPGTPNRIKETQENLVGNNKCRMQTENEEGKPNRSKRTRSIETSHQNQKHRAVRNSLVAHSQHSTNRLVT